MKRWQYIAIMIVAAIGVIISLELTNLHIKLLNEPQYQSFCNISARVNCDTVNSSKYSEIFSIPISHLGFLTYIFIFILAFFSLKGHPLKDLLSTFNLFIFIFCNIYSLILFYISLAIIKSLCILCCGLYIVNLILLIIALFNIRSYFTLNISCPLKRSRPFAITVISFFLLVIVSSIFIRNYIIEKKEEEAKRAQSKEEVVYKDIDISGSFTIGSQNAPVTVVEISDFECPFCRKAFKTLKEVLSRYSDKVRFVFKHFPLSTECNPKIRVNMHPNACFAAYAAVCAGEQGRFMEYAERLMTGELNNSAYLRYASELGLDMEKFTKCYESSVTRQSIARDIETCVKCQIVSVPTVFINGRMIIGARPAQDYIIAIEEELRKAEGKR